MRSPPPLPAPPRRALAPSPGGARLGASRGWEPLLAPTRGAPGGPLPTAPECLGPLTAVEARDRNRGAGVCPGFGAGPWREESSRETDTHLPSPSPLCPPGCWRPTGTQTTPSQPCLRLEVFGSLPTQGRIPEALGSPHTHTPSPNPRRPAGRGARSQAARSAQMERADGHGLLGRQSRAWGPGGGPEGAPRTATPSSQIFL